MASYLRSLFGYGPSSSKTTTTTPPSSSSTSRSRSGRELKSHHRSHSANTAYIYTTPVAPVRPNSKRSDSYAPVRSVPPSPLRYNTYDSSTKRSKRSATPTRSHPSSHFKYEHHVPYPIYSSSSALSHAGSDSRTDSTASIQPPPSASSSHCRIVAATPRTPSATSMTHERPQRRPVLKQHHTWHAGSASGSQHPHVSFENPNRHETIHMHPLLASNGLHKAPISYDATYTPSPQSVVDRSTHTPVPNHTLTQPATDPPTYAKLVLKCDKLPWPIVVQSSAAKGGKFFIGNSVPANASSKVPITNSDLLCAIHTTLSVRISHEEWEALGKGTRAQRKVTRAYETRCKKMGGGWDGGVRRIDWLGERTRLVGIEVDKEAGTGGVAKLVFGKP